MKIPLNFPNRQERYSLLHYFDVPGYLVEDITDFQTLQSVHFDPARQMHGLYGLDFQILYFLQAMLISAMMHNTQQQYHSNKDD